MTEVGDFGSNLSAIVLFWIWWVLLTVLDTLPTKTGDEQNPAGANTEAPGIPATSPGSEKIRRIAPAFNEQHFLAGAARAYEIIVQAYATGDLSALRPLLAPEVMAAFEDAIRQRLDRSETVALTFIGMKKTSIDAVTETDSAIEVMVRFAAEIVSVTYARDGQVIEGDPERVFDTRDLWTFAPDPAARGQSWLVTATASG